MQKMNLVIKNSLILIFFCCTAILQGSLRSRIFEVMYKGPGGIDLVQKQVLFADTKNISKDLNLPEIANRFDCKTLLGQAFILFNLEKPISPFDKSLTLQHRQSLIQILSENPEILEKLEALIAQVVEYEVDVIKFMQKRSADSSADNSLAQFFRWMDRDYRFSTYSKYMQLNSFVRAQVPSIWYDGVQAWGSVIQDMPLSNRILLLSSGLLGLSSNAQLTYEHKFVAGLFSTLYTGYSLYNHYTEALATRDALYALNKLVDIAKQVESICQQYGVEHQFKVSSVRSELGLDLLNNLSSYNNKDTNLIVSPLVNSFMYTVHDYDIHLAPVYASIAEIDAYVAIARKMINLQSTDHKFCFAQFLDVEKPMIHATEFWNMLVVQNKVVTNNLVESKNIILTGANEGGKTTTIRAILQNIVLAQSFGIAAAKQFKFTPYTKIHAYLNISDDILSGKSRYASELQQAKTILNQIEALKPEDKFFFVLDELFTGTNGEDGAQAAYDFIDNVASFSGIQFIYATHFNRLKDIGAANPQCVNYKIDPPLRDKDGQFIRDNNGQLIYPYTLSLGANNVNVALERAKEAGIFKKKSEKIL